MKKTVFSLISIIIILSLSLQNSYRASSSVLNISSSDIRIGEEFTLTVNLSFDEPAYAAEFLLLYDSDIFEFIPDDESVAGSNGSIKFVTALDGKTALSCTLKFKAVSVGFGSFNIRDCYYVGAADCEYTISNISLTVKSQVPDVNGDGVIDILDLVRLKKRICGIIGDETAGSFDINGDGDLNSLDLAELQKAIIG